MKIDYVARNCEISDKLRKITEQKLNKLDKYFGDEQAVAKVNFKKQSSFFTTEVMLDYCGNFVRATADSDNFYDNLDAVLPKLEGQIRKYRTKFDKHHKNAAFSDSAEFKGEKQIEERQTTIVTTLVHRTHRLLSYLKILITLYAKWDKVVFYRSVSWLGESIIYIYSLIKRSPK